MTGLDLSQYGIHVKVVRRNLAAAILYQEALRTEKDSVIASSGALIAYSYAKLGAHQKISTSWNTLTQSTKCGGVR